MKKFIFLLFILSLNFILACKSLDKKENLNDTEKKVLEIEFFTVTAYGKPKKIKFKSDALEKQSSFENARENAFNTLKKIIEKNEDNYFIDILSKNEYEKNLKNYFNDVKVLELKWDNENNCFVKYVFSKENLKKY